MTLRLGVLDQSPVVDGHAPAQAVAETIALARLAEDLGYGRYWLAEHHAIAALADPCPEILLCRVAAETSRMRVGTGGVLLPYYSPFKVAEIFRMLEALYPGRIDLGIGRAPGGDLRTAQAVAYGAGVSAEHFPAQVRDLAAFLDGTLPAGHPFAGVKAQPAGATSPQVWLLGSSDYSGLLAAELGLRFAFAHFINAQGGDQVTRSYKDRYVSSGREPEPHASVCCFVICAESDAEAERLARVVDSRRLDMAYNLDTPVPTQEQAEKRTYTDQERAHIQQQRARLVHGSADTCKAKLEAIAEQYSADELMVLTITGDYATRLDSYERLARAFAL
jgi:luciferase family oxidoreductase group 1